MGFMPIVGSIKEMDKRIINDGKMGISDHHPYGARGKMKSLLERQKDMKSME
jgi:hypothetical protein